MNMEIQTITVSSSRKINHQIYGGEQFESSDHFVSLSAELEVGEDVIEKHRELMQMCKELNNTSISDEILKMQGGLPWSTFFEVVRAYRLKGTLTADQSDKAQRMNRLQKAIMNELKLYVRTLKHEGNVNRVEDISEGDTVQVD